MIIQERIFQKGNEMYEYLIWRSLVGIAIVGIEVSIIEIHDLLNQDYSLKIILLISLATICLVIFNLILPFYIQICSSGMFNFCQISQVIWSYLINLFILSEKVNNSNFSQKVFIFQLVSSLLLSDFMFSIDNLSFIESKR